MPVEKDKNQDKDKEKDKGTDKRGSKGKDDDDSMDKDKDASSASQPQQPQPPQSLVPLSQPQLAGIPPQLQPNFGCISLDKDKSKKSGDHSDSDSDSDNEAMDSHPVASAGEGEKKEKMRRRLKFCLRCMEEPGWFGADWEAKKKEFEEVEQRTQSKQQKQRKNNSKAHKRVKTNHLTPTQKACLIATVYNDKGQCTLCRRHFLEFTKHGASSRSHLSQTIKQHGRVSLIFNPAPFHSHHSHPPSRRISTTVIDEIRTFCVASCFEYDAREGAMVFPATTSWEEIYDKFCQFFVERHQKKPAVSRQTLSRIVREEIFHLPVHRQQPHTTLHAQMNPNGSSSTSSSNILINNSLVHNKDNNKGNKGKTPHFLPSTTPLNTNSSNKPHNTNSSQPLNSNPLLKGPKRSSPLNNNNHNNNLPKEDPNLNTKTSNNNHQLISNNINKFKAKINNLKVVNKDNNPKANTKSINNNSNNNQAISNSSNSPKCNPNFNKGNRSKKVNNPNQLNNNLEW
eukprot:CAMPEP_0201521862 /NCGR_PEP_ID=MMETSP0161_2-20130828/16313_1 /ASSEMBLY_ACC=CAM_ASM_000251 /TAXON_ID=180227 /ORGANISM="Neoparamoeba aestuarina, Strain SoJaBio B1-5/56/2" /LENGTH=510 /DNA_ID=CAMNT_0047920583 /DNA_START=190 /DNA_END=1720 /DNA_ORIENTATION=-